MMRILFGVQGTGNGHIARSRTLARALAGSGVQVDYLLSGREPEGYFDMEAFGDYRAFAGLTFVSHEGRISPWRTLTASHPMRFWNDLSTIDCRGYDLVISDFEPLTAYAARRAGCPTLGISHQASFEWPVPRWGENGFNRWLMRHFAPVQRQIGLHWFHFGAPLLPPIIDALQPSPDNGTLLVYLPFEGVAQIQGLLSRFTLHRFVCFHPEVQTPCQWRNIEFRPPCRQGFIDALRGCRGVISNAGFELASEALSLGKKLLVKPLRGQFEQLTNGRSLALMGLATLMDSLDANTLRRWLDEEGAGRVVWPNVAQALTQWLVAGTSEPLESLSRRLWLQTQFPEEVSERLCELGAKEGSGAGWLATERGH